MSLPELKIGWHPVDPGPSPRSPLLDHPPVALGAALASAHGVWRARVEQDEAGLARQHAAQPMWHALAKPDTAYVLPVFGGTPKALDQLVATLALSGVESGCERVRVANLLQWNVLHALRAAMGAARQTSARFDVVSPSGSSVDLFGRLSTAALVGLVVDSLRLSSNSQGRRDAGRDKQELLAVADLLGGAVTLTRLRDAVDIVLGGAVATVRSSFDQAELHRLRDYDATVVAQRRVTAERLGDLHADLRELCSFSHAPSMRPELIGTGREKVRAVEVRSGSSTDGLEQAREILARALAQAFGASTPGREMLIVVGAEHLADEVLDAVSGTAHQKGQHLVLVYSRITDSAERMLGYAGSSFAVFLRLPNRSDATVASEYLGREFKFVVNGVSIAEGSTEDWSQSYGTSNSSSRSSSRSSTSNTGFGGAALNVGRSVGTSVTRSFEHGHSITQSQGGSRSKTTTSSVGRVQEYVVEPEVFQQLDDEMMFVVADRTVLLASCRHELRQSPQTSRGVLAIP